MKVTTKIIEAEGTPDELAQLLGGIVNPGVALEPAATPEAAPVVEAASVVESPTPIRRASAATASPPAASVTVPVDDDQLPLDVLALDADAIASWEDIPAEYRRVNDPGTVVHIRRAPGIATTICPLPKSKVGSRRLHDREQVPPLKGAEVCDRCVRHLRLEQSEASA